jgi:hypothetical protein
MDLNNLLEDIDNGVEAMKRSDYAISGYIGQLRGARTLVLKYLPGSIVAQMTDDEVLGTLFEDRNLAPVAIHKVDGADCNRKEIYKKV